MTLEELYNAETLLETSVINTAICNYLHKSPEYRSKYSFEDYLEECTLCATCLEFNERDKMTYHKWDVGECEELICPSCRDSEDV